MTRRVGWSNTEPVRHGHEASETSDVDIVVEMREPDLFYLVHIKETLSEDLECCVDIVSLREAMNVSLKKRIQSEAVYA